MFFPIACSLCNLFKQLIYTYHLGVNHDNQSS